MSISALEYALLAANVYGNSSAVRSEINTVKPTSDWYAINKLANSDGFMASAYRKGNEIVISFSGTTSENAWDWVTGNIPAGLGDHLAPQIADAAFYYLLIKETYPNDSITFTGHSLGGGLASVMGAYFDVKTVVFDEAPFVRSIESLAVAAELFALLSVSRFNIPDSFVNYVLSIDATIPKRRIANVTEYLTAGEILEYGATYKARPLSQRFEYATSPEKVGPWKELSAVAWATEMHSMTLLSSMMSSNDFYTMVQKYPEVLPEIMSGIYSAVELTSNTPALFELLLNSQTSGKPALDFLASNILQLKRLGQLRPDLSTHFSASIAALTQFVLAGEYQDITQNPTADLVKYLRHEKGYVTADLNLLSTTAGAVSTSFSNAFLVATGFQFMKSDPQTFRWTFQKGGYSVQTSFETDSVADAVMGFLNNDSIRTGEGNDVLYGGKGDDILNGGYGSDTYLYQRGDGTDLIQELGGQDSLMLKGVSKSQVKHYRLFNDLVLDTGTGHISFANWYLSVDYQVETFYFEDSIVSGQSLAAEPESTPTEPVEFAGNLAQTQFSFNIQAVMADSSLMHDYYQILARYASSGFPNASFTLDASTYTAGPAALSTGTGNDNLIGSNFSDTLQAGSGSNVILAGEGDDWISSGSDSTSVSTVFAEEGNDYVVIGEGVFNVDAGQGEDVVTTAGTHIGGTIHGGAGRDILTGGYGNDTIYGDSGDDLLFGGSGDDTLYGGTGANVVDGGLGDDMYYYTKGEYLLIDDIGGTDTVRLEGIKSTDVRFIEQLSDMQATVFSLQKGVEILGTDVHLFISNLSNIDYLVFDDKTITYAQYREIARTPLLGNLDDDYVAQGTTGAYRLFSFAGNDSLIGSSYGDFIDAGQGSDQVNAGQGNDVIWGGIESGEGDIDTLSGNAGDDRIYSQAATAYLFGDEGNDTLVFLGGSGHMEGGEGNDQLWGGTGADELRGGEGNDYIHAGLGDSSDSLTGEEGNDTLVKAFGDGLFYGGDGNDQVWAGTGNDVIYGDAGIGQEGNDYLNAGSGNNTVYGGGGNDALISLGGTDILEGGVGNDTLWAGAGNDTLYGDSSMVTDTYLDSFGKIRYTSNSVQVDYMYGEAGDDLMVGGLGRNLLVGGTGNDTLLAGGVFFNKYNQQIMVTRGNVDVSDFLWAGDGADVLVGNGGDYLYGEAGNDTLRSATGSNTLNGGEGDDTFYGGDTASNMFGGNGADTMYAGFAADKLYAGAGNDQLTANGNDTLQADAGDDQLISLSGNNFLWGGEGADTFTSQSSGIDHLWGQAGVDLYQLTGSGTYYVHEDNSGGVLDMSGMFDQASLASASLKNADQLYFKFTNGASVTVDGWSFQNVGIKADGRVLGYSEVMTILPTLGQR